MCGSGGQAQFAELRTREARSPALRAGQRLVSHPEGDLTLRSLSQHAGPSERHFLRLFRAQVGMSAKKYVERARVAVASRLLTETKRSPDVIAREVGFGTEATMRDAFLQVPQFSPLDCRERIS